MERITLPFLSQSLNVKLRACASMVGETLCLYIVKLLASTYACAATVNSAHMTERYWRTS